MVDREDYESIEDILDKKLDVGKTFIKHSKMKKDGKLKKGANYNGKADIPYTMEQAYLNSLKNKRNHYNK